MKAALQYATKHHLATVLDVMEKDDASIRLYERAGWRPIGEARHTFGAKSERSSSSLCRSALGHSRLWPRGIHPSARSARNLCRLR